MNPQDPVGRSELLPSRTYRALMHLPDTMHECISLYLITGHLDDEFLTAIVENDLRSACLYADDVNRYRLFDYVNFFYNFTPSNCWGTQERVRAWIAHQGLSGG